MEGDFTSTELHRLNCTRGHNRVCQLLRHLTACNEVLWHAGLQLNEDTRDELGDVSVAIVPSIRRRFPSHTERAAIVLLCRLIGEHRCIVSAELNYSVANTAPLDAVLAASSSLRRLRVIGIASDRPEIHNPLSHTSWSPHYTNEFVFHPVCAHSYARLTIPNCLLTRDGAVLTSLHVAATRMNQATAGKLIDALIQNSTITELSVGACVFSCGPRNRPSEHFAHYLTKKDATLRKLTLRAVYFDTAPGCQILVQAICAMTTLQELAAQFHAGSRDYVLFTRVIAESRSIRTLSLRFTGFGDGQMIPYPPQRGHVVDGYAWASALVENSTLKELVLDMSWSSSEDCCVLLRALASNRSIKKLTLHSLPHDGGLRQVCGTIQEYELAGRVCIEDHRVGPRDLPTLSDCPELTAVILSYGYLPHTTDLLSALDVLATCSHVASLTVCLDFFHIGTYESLCAYIRSASALRAIDLTLRVDQFHADYFHAHFPDESPIDRSMVALCEALSSNLRIAKIMLELTVQLRDDVYPVLARAATNPRLYELCLRGVNENFCAAFLRCLMPGLAQEYNLRRLEIHPCASANADMFAAQDIVRRNRSLVERATRFAVGDREPYCARPFELLSKHPVLVDSVRARASLRGEAEAADAIKAVERSLRLADVDEYMRLTGVVETRVECNVRHGGGKQLDQLNYDCWTGIQKYLKVADVLET
ncbi:uncharacterized protein LOC142590086 [Dermacentor variabilis]|uniref:uncharacterized protein LOC142590086 n=1 Tax=Dermacentor variabilis TaxID=34621 RepID=UPI003F5C8D8F